MKLVTLAALATLIAAATPAAAAAGPDLATTITPPTTEMVKATGRYTITIANVGNQHANSASVAIALPPTHTSPQVYVLGVVVGYSAGCTLSGTTLTCALGQIRRNKAVSVWVDLKLQESASPLVIAATAATAGDTDGSNDGASHTASLVYVSPTAGPPGTGTHRHCTGTGLTAFYECTLFPSSITSHVGVYAGSSTSGTISFPGEPGFSGTWTRNGSDFAAQFYDGVTLVGSFVGHGVSGTCYEGLTTFDPPWVSPYEVCF